MVAVTYDRLFMGGSNYILYLVLCSSKRLPTSNILSVFTQTVFKQIEKAIFFFSQATLDDVQTKVSHVLTPNNSSIKSRGPVGEEQADVSEQLLNLTVDVTEISEAVHRQSRKLAELVCELINLLLVTVLLLLLAFVDMNLFLCVFLKLIKTQLSQAHVMRVWNVIYFLTRESVSHYKQPLRSCMRIKILRSANAKYHYILPFFYKINKGDLLLKYLCVCWCEFMDLINFLALLCDPCHSIHKTKSMRLHRNTTGSPYLVYLKMVCGLKTH